MRRSFKREESYKKGENKGVWVGREYDHENSMEVSKKRNTLNTEWIIKKLKTNGHFLFFKILSHNIPLCSLMFFT